MGLAFPDQGKIFFLILKVKISLRNKGAMTLSITTICITTFKIIILRTKAYFVTLHINDTEHYNNLSLC
jgi:hypothetical protein